MLNTIDAATFQRDIVLHKDPFNNTDVYPSTHPFIATGKDSKPYICKLYTNEIGNLPVINEYICYLLAKEFNLPLEEAVLFNLSDEIITSTTKLHSRGILSNTGFALKWNRKANPNIRQPALDRCKNMNIIPTLLYFDQLILNKDRSLNDGNLLFDSKESKIVVIDHSHVFENGELWDSVSLNSIKSKWLVDNFNEKYYNMLLPYINGNNPFNPTIELAKKIKPSRIKEIVESVPKEWNFEKEKKDALIDFLIYRNENYDKIISNIKPFCLNWKGGVMI